jgi:hypothetical protein
MSFKKSALIAIIIMIHTQQATSQDIRINTGKSSTGIVLNMNNATVTVQGHDKNEILVRTGTSGATDLKAAGLTTEEKGGGITVHKTDDAARTYTFLVPSNMSVSYTDQSVENGKIDISGVKGNVKVVTMLSKISLADIGGSIYARSEAETISLAFNKQSPPAKVELITLGQDVKLLAPQGFAAAFDLQVMTGEVTSDFKTSVSGSDLKGSGQQRKLKFKLNDGKVPIHIAAHTIALKQQ